MSMQTCRRYEGFLVFACVQVCVLCCSCNEDGSVSSPTPVFPSRHQFPSWSVQDEIAFRDEGVICVHEDSSYLIDPNRVGIWVVHTTSTERERLIPFGDTPEWSPDGTRLAFSRDNQIHVVRRDGSEMVTLTTSGWNFFPRWAPDGKRLAWNSTLGDSSGIWIANVDGSSADHVLPPGSSYPDWHPAADKLLYVVSEVGSKVHAERLMEFDLEDGSTRLVLRIENGEASFPAYSPDGTRVAIAHRPGGERLFRIWTMNADGTDFHPVTTGPGEEPSWAPSGEEILYSRIDPWINAPEMGVLWIVNLVTGEEKERLEGWPEICQ